MSGWAEEQAKRISDEEIRLQKERDWQLHIDAVADREARPLFDKVCQQIESYVSEFNQARGTTEVQCESVPGQSILVAKDSFPSIRTEIALSRSARVIRLRRQESAHALGAIRPHDEQFRFTVDSASSISIEGVSYDRFAKTVLQPVFDSFLPQR